MNPLSVAIAISISAVLVCALIVLHNRHRTKRIMERLSLSLDKAISGNFDETTYDESRLSQIETKLWRFLSTSKLSRNNIEKERDKIKSLISDISHQTKNPIANIILYTELLLEREDLPEKAKQLSEQIRPHAEKLHFLIGSLIKTSRLESGIVAVQPAQNNISELISNAVSECLPKADAKNISLTIKENSVPIALFDPKWTTEALHNIIDNALKYTVSGGQVTVSSAAYDMFIRIDVRDNGIGIPESEHSKLFARFWRSPSAANAEGVGIGLYLAREIISAQDGYIKVKSEPGKGSTFSVFLPRA